MTGTAKSPIAIAGAGRMGRGIAVSFAWAGHPVALVDSEPRTAGDFVELRREVCAGLEAEIATLAEIGALAEASAPSVTARIEVVPRAAAEHALAEAACIFEAVSEVLDVKHETYAWLGRSAAETTVIASTTSTMLADTLAEGVQNPARFTNAHWLNPAYLMPLVEISPAALTSAETVTALRALLESIGKRPVVCKASPGYIVSRLQSLVLNEAARMVDDGIATAADIDTAVRTGFGPRYATFGPLEFIDWGGGDILYYASKYLAGEIDPVRFAPAAIVERNMHDARNGLRDGRGFYDYRDRDVAAYRRERLTELVRLLATLGLLPAGAGGAEP